METSEAYEEQHVHSVYEEIATNFSSTRYKVCVPMFHLNEHRSAYSNPLAALAASREISQGAARWLDRC
jgi:hypothetical protein